MDIDDILAEVSADVPGGGGGSVRGTEARDLQALTRAWVNEKAAPELLAWPAELMERTAERLRRQIELVEEQTGDVDPRVNFRLIIVQTELERVKFLVRSFVRTRLAKIDQYLAHYLSLPAARQSRLMSPAERGYADSHQALLSRHFHSSFLSAFPPALQRLDDTSGGISMVDGPDLDAAVFVRGLKSPGGSRPHAIAVPGTDTDFDLARGDVWLTRWSAVGALVASGDAELV